MSKGHGCMIQYVILEELGILSTPGSRSLLQARWPARRPSRLRQSRHRGFDRLARPWPVDGGRHGAGGARPQDRRHHLHRAQRRRGAGRLDLGGRDDGVLARLLQHRRLRRQQRLPEPRPHLRDASVVLSAGRKSSRRSAGRRPRSTATTPRPSSLPSPAAQRQEAVHGRAPRPPRARASATWRTCRSGTTARPTSRNIEQAMVELERMAVMRNTFSEALYQAATRQSRHLHRRGRHLAGRQHGEVQQAISRPLHQCRRRRAEHDRHLRRPCAQGLPALRLYDRDLLALSAVRDGARRPVLPEPAGDGGRHGRRRHLLDARRHAPHAGRHRHRRRDPEHADHRAVRSGGVHAKRRASAPRRRTGRSTCVSARPASRTIPTRRSSPGCSASCATSSAAATCASSPMASSCRRRCSSPTRFEATGKSVSVVSCHTLKPLDRRRHRRCARSATSTSS